MDNQIYIKEEREEQDEYKIDIKDELIASEMSEDSEDQELNQKFEFVKCEPLSNGDSGDNLPNNSHKIDFPEFVRKHANLKELTCLICNKTYPEKSGIIVHMKMHAGVKDFECSFCGKRFAGKKYMINHVHQVHMGVVPDVNKIFECPVCKKRFDRNHNMSRHKKIHTAVKDLECEICHKKFSQNTALEIHRKLHTNVRDYKCSICNKAFLHKNSLRRHMLTHANIKIE